MALTKEEAIARAQTEPSVDPICGSSRDQSEALPAPSEMNLATMSAVVR